MAKTKNYRKSFRVYASNNGITAYADLLIYSFDGSLTAEEFAKIARQFHRNIPKLVEGLPWTDFGIDNIDIRKVRK